MTPFWRNGRFWAALLLAGGLLAAALYTGRARPAVEEARGLWIRATAPVFRLIDRGAYAVSQAAGTLVRWKDLPAENARLRKENESLRQLAVENEELRQENDELRELLDLRRRPPGYDTAGGLAAAVIGRLPERWYDEIVVDRGAADGVARGMPVVTPDGLVGRVAQVTPHQAVVLLLTNPDSGVGALVQRQTSRSYGVVVGAAGTQSRLRMTFFSRDADAVPGDIVVTSGLGGLLPKGIPVGVVTRVDRSQDGLVLTAELQPAADLNRLEWVLILPMPQGVSP
ncbi:MAG: rod shape-determining protein MreC [Firmicutes bacterium]|nr:rod shape-determining protein MreC [Bacillota bacterium]